MIIIIIITDFYIIIKVNTYIIINIVGHAHLDAGICCQLKQCPCDSMRCGFVSCSKEQAGIDCHRVLRYGTPILVIHQATQTS